MIWLPGSTRNRSCNSTTCRRNTQQFRGKQFYFSLGVFIDLSKAFDIVDHNILLKKLGINGTVSRNFKCFKNYLNDRKQYIQINNVEKTNLLLVKCGVPQGSILGSHLSLIYINNL